MTILNATDSNGVRLSLDQMLADHEELKVKHEQALKAEPTWAFFGGVLTVNGHEYQVA